MSINNTSVFNGSKKTIPIHILPLDRKLFIRFYQYDSMFLQQKLIHKQPAFTLPIYQDIKDFSKKTFFWVTWDQIVLQKKLRNSKSCKIFSNKKAENKRFYLIYIKNFGSVRIPKNSTPFHFLGCDRYFKIWIFHLWLRLFTCTAFLVFWNSNKIFFKQKFVLHFSVFSVRALFEVTGCVWKMLFYSDKTKFCTSHRGK